jgi:hypothetical protein
MIVSGCPTLGLILSRAGNQSTHQVELSPVDFGRIRGINIWVAFVRSKEVRHVHFPRCEINDER